MNVLPAILGVGTAVPGSSYTQRELLDEFGIDDPKVRSIFLNSAIERRNLVLPPRDAAGRRVCEPQGDLLRKHKKVAVEMGASAVEACLKHAGVTADAIAHLCCVTSTGFLTPGLSALIIRELGLSRHAGRSDIVGMGCNAGLNALHVVSGWASAHPGELAIVLCAEACSAAYALDSTLRTAVVNSLFGDGAAAAAVLAADDPGLAGAPRIMKSASIIVTDALDAMRYDWDDGLGRFSFYLDPQIPYVVGAHAGIVVDRLLDGTGLRRRDIDHWLVHSGGKKVIDSIAVNLGLTRHDLRNTITVLRDHGNLSSGSFLFSYERLEAEGTVHAGDHAVLMTMGPGSTIETMLVRWGRREEQGA